MRRKRRERKVDDGEFRNAVRFVGMVLSQKIHGAFKSAVERMTGPRTVSAFKEKGVLQDQDRAAWLYQAMIARKRHSQVTWGSFNFVNSVCDLSACSVDSKEESSCLSTGSSDVSTTASRIKLINQKSYEKLRVVVKKKESSRSSSIRLRAKNILEFLSSASASEVQIRQHTRYQQSSQNISNVLSSLSCVLESVAYSYRLTVLIKPSSTIILDKQCAFKEKGVLSVSEFVLASDNLVFKCPTWSCLQYFLIPFCTPATEREKTVREMAAKREFLDLTGIPFTRGLLLPPLSSHCNSSVEYSCGSRTR
ncbi:hypothetical protein F2Q69_00013892 [Brassica cretica]|uniref:HTH three-helical bundle domain-containing protein n=1 Tax=Brassica cretica TaxID=69181 RepID=A0A8S9QPX7_BRACR|nr:hypothetical protein F2Q69_00013892 [Brassica cretica]